MAALIKPFRGRLGSGLYVPVGALAVDSSHPLALGLIGCYLPGVSGGINLAGGGGDLQFDTAAVFDATSEGPSSKGGTANAGLYGLAPAQFLTFPNGVSFYYRGYRNASGTFGVNSNYIGIDYSNAGTSPSWVAGMWCATGSATTALLGGWNTAGGDQFPSVTISSPVSTQVSLAISVTAGGVMTAYNNGSSQGTSSGTALMPTSSASSSVVINPERSFLATRSTPCSCNIACIWNRVLSAAEMQAVHLAPYDFLAPNEVGMSALQLPSAFIAAWAQRSNPIIGSGVY